LHLYQGTSEQFIADAVQARLANQLAERFFQEFRYRPAPSEVMSWRNSAKARTGKAQIDDILDASRVSVFFIDDLQVVRPGEVGSTDMIREAAAKRSLEVREFELTAQFRRTAPTRSSSG
jgi:hypothetical protein